MVVVVLFAVISVCVVVELCSVQSYYFKIMPPQIAEILKEEHRYIMR